VYDSYGILTFTWTILFYKQALIYASADGALALGPPFWGAPDIREL